jgi:hypothetical protein
LDRIDLAVEKAPEGGGVDFDVDQLDLDTLLGERPFSCATNRGP